MLLARIITHQLDAKICILFQTNKKIVNFVTFYSQL